jgi:hypothetical protein
LPAVLIPVIGPDDVEHGCWLKHEAQEDPKVLSAKPFSEKSS